MTTQPAPEATAPPESQFSMNWQMIDGFGGNVQVTMRATHLREWPEIFTQRKEFCEAAQKGGWTFPGTVKPAPGLVTPSVPAVPAAPANGATVPPAPAVSVGATANQILSVHAVRMEVTPRADGKVDAKFFEAGHKYPDIYSTRTPEEMAKQLSATGGWTAEHFKVAQAFDVGMVIEYRLSEKLNSKGKPFKDVVAIKPA